MTEIGVIPEDWEVMTFGDVFQFLKTGSNSRSDLSNSGNYKYIHYGDIHTKWSGFLDCSNDTIPRIEYSKVNHLPLIQDGDLIMADASEDYEGVGASIEAFNVGNQTVVSGLHTLLLRGNKSILSDGFKGYLQNIISIREQLQALATGISVYGISKSNLRNVKLPIPSLGEQRAIADALSEVDAQITALDALIAKQQDIKQGSMQRLLTGEERLPGYEGEWEVKRLGEITEKIVGGGTPSRSNLDYWNGDIPWVTVKDFATFNPHFTQETITKEGLQNSSSNLIPKGKLITSTRMALGKAVIYEVDVSINQDLKAIFPISSIDGAFLYFWFQKNAEMIESLGSGSTVKGISLADLRDLPFPKPTKKEQQAIAAVLSDMDAKISILKEKREKFVTIKQGMMQELLTGKTRLV